MNKKYEIRQLSLVAFFGDKNSNKDFWEHIDKIQIILEKEQGINYLKYKPEQIHGTIIGLEAAKYGSSVISKNFFENRHKVVSLRLLSILKQVLKSDLLPFEIKIGGFDNKEYNFTSRSISPYKRSFIIQDKIVVTMGWPFYENAYIPVLDTFRKQMSQYGALHKYHTAPDSYDNDFFFVLGTLKNSLPNNESENLQVLIQNEMKTWKNVGIKITKEDLGIVAYKDTKLENVRYYSLLNAIKDINELNSFYPEYENAVKNKDWLE